MIDTALNDGLRNIVVAGRGPESAAVAAALGVSLQGNAVKITLVSPVDGRSSIGVARIRGGKQSFHSSLGIDEQELIRETSGVIALGTRFTGFADGNESIFVPLGGHGMTLRLVPFHQYWRALRSAGDDHDFNDYSLPAAAAAHGRFVPVQQSDDPVFATVEYDILVDPDLYTHFFRQVARDFGVTEMNDTVSATMTGAGGHIEAVRLAGGSKLDGDLFIDCSAERAIYSALDSSADIEDWSDWLQCDRLLSVLTKKLRAPELFTSTKAISEGWLQRNTLQNFTVESLAYCSHHLDDDDAKAILEKSLKHPPLSSSQLTPSVARRLRKPWRRNCVAIGRAALEIEPLCVSILQVAQNTALRLLAMLPASRENSVLATEFNRITGEEHAGIRDFTILHYHLANRLVSPFWQAVRRAALPDALRKRLELFTTNGRISVGENEWFDVQSWLSCLISFGVLPHSGDPLVDMADQEQVESRMRAFREAVRKAVTG